MLALAGFRCMVVVVWYDMMKTSYFVLVEPRPEAKKKPNRDELEWYAVYGKALPPLPPI